MTTENVNAITIDTPDGDVKIDPKLFKSYIGEAFQYLEQIQHNQECFKEVVETVAETTGMKPAKVSKYLKAKYAEKLADTTATGELFAQLEEILA